VFGECIEHEVDHGGHAECHKMSEPMVAAKDHRERIGIASLRLSGELLIAERKQFRIGNAI